MAIYVLWGTTYLGIRVATETIPPFLLSGFRYGIAGLVLLVWGLFDAREARLPRPRHWLNGLLSGGVMIGVGNGLLCWSEQWLPSGLAALLYIAPFFIALFARLLIRERISRLGVAGLVVGFAGLVVLVSPGLAGPAALVPMLATVLASAGWALGSVLSRKLDLPRSSIQIAGLQMFAGGAVTTLFAAATGELAHFHLQQVSVRSNFAFWYLLLFGAVIGFALFAYLIQSAPLPVVATYGYVNPMVAFFLGALVLGEKLTLTGLIGGAVVVVGVAMVISSQRRRPAREAPLVEGP